MKSIHIWSFSGPYFPAFGLNTNQKNSEYGNVSHGQFSKIANFMLDLINPLSFKLWP